MTKLSGERMGEIALKMVKRQAMDREFPSPNDFRREIGNYAKDIDETTETLVDFFEAILPDILGKMLGRKSVSITTTN
jgi:hypothetical protein